ncbi:MAG: hypothetical protein MJ133_03950 [Lachnospiraceae bacterium]|nr:hypothetical protein [Lachnospiraceae bacterium]
MKCIYCGRDNADGIMYCGNCGQKIISSNAPGYDPKKVVDVIERVAYSFIYLLIFIVSFLDWHAFTDYGEFRYNPYYTHPIVTDYYVKDARGWTIFLLIIVQLFILLALLNAALGKKTVMRGWCGGSLAVSILLEIVIWGAIEKGHPTVGFWLVLIFSIIGLCNFTDIFTASLKKKDVPIKPIYDRPVQESQYSVEACYGENITIEGAPFDCIKTNLIIDKNGSRYVENIFKNKGRKVISGIQVDIYGMDSFGTTTENIWKYPYQDIKLLCGNMYGQGIYIPLTNPNTRQYAMYVNIVLFNDGTRWESEGKDWIICQENDISKQAEAGSENIYEGFNFYQHSEAMSNMNNSAIEMRNYLKQFQFYDNKFLAVMKELEGMAEFERLYGKPHKNCLLILERIYNETR